MFTVSSSKHIEDVSAELCVLKVEQMANV